MDFKDCRKVYDIPSQFHHDSDCAQYCINHLNRAHACVTRFYGRVQKDTEYDIPKFGSIICGLRFKNVVDVTKITLIYKMYDLSVFKFHTCCTQEIPFSERINFYNDMVRISLGNKFHVNSFPSGYPCLHLSIILDGNADLYLDCIYFNKILCERMKVFVGGFSMINKQFFYDYDTLINFN